MRSTLALASVGIGASASVIVPPYILPRGEAGSAYTFTLEAHGKASGPIGQLSDGQNRIGGSLPLGYFTIKYGSKGGVIVDKNGRGCILTPPTTQFQCDQGVGGTPGFDVSCDKQLLYNGSPEFWACPVDDHGVWNLYTKPNFAQKKCITITLSVHGDSSPAPTCKQSTPPPPPPCKGDCKPPPPPSYNKGKLSPDGTCGGTTGFNCNGFVDGSCCSSYGWCGYTPAHCGAGCQGDFGTCKMPKDEYKPMPPSPPPCDDKDNKCKPAPPPPAPCKDDKCKPAPPPAPCMDDKCKPAPPPTAPCKDNKCTPSPPPAPCMGDKCKPLAMTSGCPADLKGPYEFPHLIIPVNKRWPDKAYGSKLNGTFTPDVCSIFNFDISPRLAGKTCSLTFLFPKQERLETSAYRCHSVGGKASLQFSALTKPADWQTTWNNVGEIWPLAKGSVYPDLAIGAYTHKCPAGRTESIMVCGNNIYMDYFQDFNPSPIGLYMRAC